MEHKRHHINISDIREILEALWGATDLENRIPENNRDGKGERTEGAEETLVTRVPCRSNISSSHGV